MIEKNGIDARSGKKSHIGDEDLVGIPKFYNKEHDFYSHNLFDFHKFGLNIKAASLVKAIENFKDFKGIPIVHPYGWMNLNLYDDEIIEGVKCVSDLISVNPNDYPKNTTKDVKKVLKSTLITEFLSFKNENNLLFLSGGVDSVLCMLLAKSMSLPTKYIHIHVNKNTTAYIQHLQKRYNLDIDYINIEDIEITDDFYKKSLTYNPNLWPVGGTADVQVAAIACLDRYKEYQNVIIGIRERYLFGHFWNVYELTENDFEFGHYNLKYGPYLKFFPDKERTKWARKYANKLERQKHVFKFMRSYVNFEGLTNKYFAKSAYSKNLIQSSHGMEDKEELIKSAYKVPQQEVCKEIDSGWEPIKDQATTTFFRAFPVSHERHIYNWFINYEKARRTGGVAL